MKYDVRTYGDPALREKAEPVRAVDDRIRRLARDMLKTMYASNGIGLAAEQVGRKEAVCVISVPQDPEGADPEQALEAPAGDPAIPMPLVMINPQIVEMNGEQAGQEGCLSFPEIYVSIKRAAKVRTTFLDLQGKSQTVEATGLLARAIQHEADHLNGVLLVDRMSAVQKVAVAGKLKRLKAKA